MWTSIKAFLSTPHLLDWSQLVLAVLMVTAILLQSQGTGLGATFGGEGNTYRTKRGLEKTLFRGTIVLAVLFFTVALLNVLF